MADGLSFDLVSLKDGILVGFKRSKFRLVQRNRFSSSKTSKVISSITKVKLNVLTSRHY